MNPSKKNIGSTNQKLYNYTCHEPYAGRCAQLKWLQSAAALLPCPTELRYKEVGLHQRKWKYAYFHGDPTGLTAHVIEGAAKVMCVITLWRHIAAFPGRIRRVGFSQLIAKSI
jgi:hypothetical protein